ncbi:YHYH protein [Aquimarina sp. U1-2]|uniref:YHYH protein n=1 Tax=Aquimarina sp. U1-2 TaxID=2823141 RepID=UPI001AED0F10|nr:YHYH protein [Aquimarina sp. U1-2]MBP2830664.1 YHYH protein [Aquimarina sp. U1-2]
MKTFSFSLLVFFLFYNSSLLAHKGGHGHENLKQWRINNETIEAAFLISKEDKVFLETKSGQIIAYDIASFSYVDQKHIQKKVAYIDAVNHLASHHPNDPEAQSWQPFEMTKKKVLIIVLVMAIICFFIFKKRKQLLGNGIFTLSILIVLACDDSSNSSDDEPSQVPANDVSQLEVYFGHFSGVTTTADDSYLYVESNGIPEHGMMTGITNWQQQVPIDQNYTKDNSWAFPLQPVLAETPLLSSEHFMRGAIAIAVNGIPVFNPLNNRGEDAFVIGELDNWGGHCGRADDYHYHIPPTHLEAIIGSDQPLAYALDGFPIYGETTDELDEYLGKFNEDGSYQYHTTNTFPYFIAGMRGQVTLDPNSTAPEDQILPQALTQEVRPALMPLAGAEITNFSSTGTNAYSLEYQIGIDTYYTNYSWDENGLYTYEYVDSEGNITIETYQR